VRVAGVSVGKVVRKELDTAGNRTLATIELESKYAPLKRDARAILRQKTLLGETYVELTTGSRRVEAVPEGGRLANAQVAPTVEFDELLRIFDPKTRDAFRLWQREVARASAGRGADVNAALGSLPGFAASGASVLDVLNRRREALRGLIRDTGTTFEAITRDEDKLREFISRTQQVFETTAGQRENLAETIRIFPTFLDESKATLARLQTFARETDPLVAELDPVLRDLQPTLADVRRLSPHLERLFGDLDPLIAAGRDGLPALGDVFEGLKPLFARTGPFFAQLNPMLQYLALNQPVLTDFISIGASGLAIKTGRQTPSTNGHALPQLIVLGSQTPPAATRTADNRGNAYWGPGALADPRMKGGGFFTLPNWDCKHVGGERPADSAQGCFEQAPIEFQGLTKRFPHVQENHYANGTR
jgi:phospholipid/cholesterol/gamma-HCH transport system substrate-binding protein